MTPVSQALAELMNLRNAADAHIRDCGEACNVSVSQLLLTGRRLFALVWETEREEARKLLEGWPS